MKQRTSRLSLKVAGIGLAILGFCTVLGSIGDVRASQPALSKSIVSVDRVSTGDYATIRVGRGIPDTKKCPRSNDGCETNLPPKPPAPSTPQ